MPGQPGTPNTTVNWYPQWIDHFSWAPTPSGATTFGQRYLTYTEHWARGGPIFFYCGNEANVELYANATGLMWENARDFGAALVFAEHRYYGESQPFGSSSGKHLQYLTVEQALADYAQLAGHLRSSWGSGGSAVVAFGGSYGGMLAAWLRMKYPGAVDGAIAASAPVLAFSASGVWSDGEAFWRVVTRDASADAGSAPECAANVRQSWRDLFALGHTGAGRRELQRLFRLCGEEALQSEDDVMRLALMHLNAWDSMAMGNFPYPSNYLIYQQTQDPTLLLPAFPVRAACKHVSGHFTSAEQRLAALRDATGVFNNASGQACLELPTDPNFDGIWDYQWCTEMMPQETYFSRDGVHDMFWPSQLSMAEVRGHCRKAFGVEPRADWIPTEFGSLAGASNIVFSNGAYDPWSAGGVLANVSDTVVAVVIPEGAHHLDLMFSTPHDPEAVRAARQLELLHVRRWVASASRQRPPILV